MNDRRDPDGVPSFFGYPVKIDGRTILWYHGAVNVWRTIGFYGKKDR